MQKIAFPNMGGSHTKCLETVRQLAVEMDTLHAQHRIEEVAPPVQVRLLKNFDNRSNGIWPVLQVSMALRGSHYVVYFYETEMHLPSNANMEYLTLPHHYSPSPSHAPEQTYPTHGRRATLL